LRAPPVTTTPTAADLAGSTVVAVAYSGFERWPNSWRSALDAGGVQWNAMGLSVVNAAKNKLVGLLSQKLAPDNIYVGQLTVLVSVKGGPFDDGHATLEPATVARRFWDLYKARSEARAEIG
jgi:hypothetical protein